jgi:KaiC/GvpD/RAD55 family RecA-like ATPase
MQSTDRVRIGDPTLDEMLGGGLPAGRSVLLSGGHGTGKSTIAMQFLQQGLENDEECLFVSTEQTVDELHDSFAGFEFDLDHENLEFTSIHATPGQTLEGEDELTLETLDSTAEAETGAVGGGFNAPFTAEYIMDHLRSHAPCDRVVFDSVSGLSVVSDGTERFRRTVLDLIRLFTDEFDATTLFTAEDREEDASGDLLRFTTHGVVELSRELVDEDVHRFLEVTKMRGIDHDTRRVELEFVADGVRVGPSRRSQPPALKNHRHRAVGIPGLDQLCGGGVVRGAGVLLEHDGRANLSALYSTLLSHAFETDQTVTLVPSIELRQSNVETLLESRGYDLRELLDDGDLFVVDLVGTWDIDHESVYRPGRTADALKETLSRIDDDSDGLRFSVFSADVVTQTLGESEARDVRYFEESNLLDDDDTLLHVLDPSLHEGPVGPFYRNAAEQVLELWMRDDGLQYLTLRKSPCGFVGSTSLVEYVDEPPYLRVQHPPRTRENPYACE